MSTKIKNKIKLTCFFAHEDHQRAGSDGVGSGGGVGTGVSRQCEVKPHFQFEVETNDPWIRDVRWVPELETEVRRSGNLDFCK